MEILYANAITNLCAIEFKILGCIFISKIVLTLQNFEFIDEK